MQNIENAIQELVSKQTLSLEAIDIVKKIKDDYANLVMKKDYLDSEFKKVIESRDVIQKEFILTREKLEVLKKDYTALKVREERIKETELKCTIDIDSLILRL